MKQAKRRLLSVVMALAILCSLVPSALAYTASTPISMSAGQTTTLTAPFADSIGSLYGLKRIDWNCNSGAVTLSASSGTANKTAYLTANYAGTATITATAWYYDGVLGTGYAPPEEMSWTVTVSGSYYPGGNTGYYATISQSNLYLSAGGSSTLTVSSNTNIPNYYNYSLQNFRWNSSNTAAVSVSGSGNTATVTALQNTGAVITVSVDVYQGYNFVTTEQLTCLVNAGGTGGMLSLSSGNLQMNPSSVASLTANVNTSVPAGTMVYWSSSKPEVVQVPTYSYAGSAITLTSGAAAGQSVITASCSINGQTYTATCTVTVGNGGQVTLSSSALQMSPNSTSGLTVQYVNGTAVPPTAAVTWKTSNPSIVGFYTGGTPGSSANGTSVVLYAGLVGGQATITAEVVMDGKTYTGSCLVTVGSSLDVKATVSTGEIGFTLGSTNGKTQTSVVSQIANALYSNSGAARNLSYVIFDNVSTTYGSLNATVGTRYDYSSYATYYSSLAAITFTPASYTGTAVFRFTAYDTMGNAYPGTLTFVVEKGGSSLDVFYTGTVGQTIQINAADFSTFWSKATNGQGSLQYVVFNPVASNMGRLYYTATNGQQVAVSTMNQFYVSPSYNQTSLSSVTFVPTKQGVSYLTGCLTVPFTAYGTTTSYGTGVTTQSGVMYISVTNGAVQDINYQAPTSGVKLNGADFATVYQKAQNNVQSSVVYIQFLDVPAFGTLYYGNGSILTAGTKLTSSNIGSMTFSSSGVGNYNINNITYVPSGTKASDTVRYVAYSMAGGSPLYVGEINFNATAAGSIKYHTNSAGVTFKSSDFFNTDTGLLSVQYITFGKPSSGTLYKNYSNGKGTVVGTNDLFSYTSSGSQVSSINNVTYVPAAGYTGVVSIPYTGSNITGAQISGTIKVYVVAKAFTDVPTTHWSYEYVTELTASGIVNGVTPTTFYPNSEVKYGEALKLIMLAAGYSEQAKTGSHWASGYLTRAYRDGLVTNPNLDLNATVDRNTIASIAAKALKLSPVTNITSPFVDSNDGYVLALYQAGIVEGTTNGGRTYYYGTSTIKRSEICAIICRINDYNQ